VRRGIIRHCQRRAVVFDEFAQARRAIGVLERADVLVDAGFGYAEFLRDHLDRHPAVDTLHHGALSVGQPPRGSAPHPVTPLSASLWYPSSGCISPA